LRFRFNPSVSAAVMVYLVEPLLLVVTLGLYYPAWERSKRHYVISSHRLGDAYFHFEGRRGRFYGTYFIAGLIFVCAAVIAGTLLMSLVSRNEGRQPVLFELLPFFALYAFGFFLSKHYIYADLLNHVWNHTRLDDHRFRAEMQTSRWLGLQLTNLGAIIVSCGLLYPWAAIRAQRYAASCLHFVPAGPVDQVQRVGGGGGSATGDTAAEFFGLDFGL
jgi:uncharacterized membrane protein YjgN (DUF898 family)